MEPDKYSTAIIGCVVLMLIFVSLGVTSFGTRHRYDLLSNLHWARPLAQLAELTGLLGRHSLKLHCASQRSNEGYEGTDLSYRSASQLRAGRRTFERTPRAFRGVARDQPQSGGRVGSLIMQRQRRIPLPPSQLWREFRVRIVPFGLFLAATAGVLILWRQNIASPNFEGEVEAVRSAVSSPKAGRLSQSTVSRLQRVHAGDVIGQVITTDPQILQSSLAVIQAEIQLLRVNLQPIMGQQRYALNYDHMRLDWMDQRAQLASDRVRAQLAETELRRTQELFNEKIVSEALLDAARSAKESLEAELKEREVLVTEQEKRLEELNLGDIGSANRAQSSPEDILRASIKVQEQKLRLTEVELSPINLTVHMDGMVAIIHHRSGEAILAGEPIVTLTALKSDRILGYVRQPLAFQPRIGMKVEVRARSLDALH